MLLTLGTLGLAAPIWQHCADLSRVIEAPATHPETQPARTARLQTSSQKTESCLSATPTPINIWPSKKLTFILRQSSLRGRVHFQGTGTKVRTTFKHASMCNPRIFLQGRCNPPKKLHTPHALLVLASLGKRVMAKPCAGCRSLGVTSRGIRTWNIAVQEAPDYSRHVPAQPPASACSRLGASARRPKPPACSGSSRSCCPPCPARRGACQGSLTRILKTCNDNKGKELYPHIYSLGTASRD